MPVRVPALFHYFLFIPVRVAMASVGVCCGCAVNVCNREHVGV